LDLIELYQTLNVIFNGTGDLAMQLPDHVTDFTITPTLAAVLGAAVEFVLPALKNGNEAGG
jgi:hypothetical protein